MTTGPAFRESLLEARQRLLSGREEIKQQHLAGSPGIQISTRMTELLDTVVLDLYEAALSDTWPTGSEEFREQVALVAHGGFGRRDVAPYSDVDLMILYSPDAENAVRPLASRLVRDLSDARLDVGHSLRTPAQACALAIEDATICTSLMESRFLAGSHKLFTTFFDKFQRRSQRAYKSLFKAIDQARRKERQQYGETVYLLEPNIKRSRGGLRDLQLLRWLGFARYGTTDLDDLQQLGAISKVDQRALRDATEYLLRLRNELHFHAERSHDVLNRGEQLRLAPLYGFQGTDAILPVEQFMREYFSHTRAVRSVVSNYVSTARPGGAWDAVLGSIFSHQVEGDYRVTPRQIVATDRGLKKLQGDLSEVLRLCDIANLHNKRIAPATWDAVRVAVPQLSGDISPAICEQFLSLISKPGRLGDLLRKLLELGVLEKIIPGFTHARCLLQFNEYHKYTVDEHCILAVERATEFISDRGVLGRVYRGIKDKRTLHLALLVHDLGKGFVEDHSDVGARIAVETAKRLGVSERDTETLRFLVHKHLVMSHLAFWRDTSDSQVVVKFAVDVGSPEMLDMLYVLTAADIAAVGPGTLNSWKSEVLTDLYKRTLRHLAGDASAADSVERLAAQREAVQKLVAGERDADWFARQIEALPSAYAFNSPPEQIATELRDLHTLAPGDVHASGRFIPESKVVEFVVGTQEQITPGVFHKLTGALAGQGLQILSAEINTLADGLVLDRFYVVDPDYAVQPPQDRLEQVTTALIESLKSPHGTMPAFRNMWRGANPGDRAPLVPMPTRVLADNSTSESFTIIDVFACDRRGLLFTIARTLFELELSVSVAKIGTYLDQVVDVFYVTDPAGKKVLDDGRLQQISERLLAAIDGMAPT